MKNWPDELLDREFRPREIEAITGHSTALQRQWAARFDFARTSAIFRDRESGREPGRWFTWTGMQMLAIFGDVIGDLGDNRLARSAVMFSQIGRRDTNIYEFDFRDCGDNGDLLIQTDLSGKGIHRSIEGDRLFFTTSVSSLARNLRDADMASMRPDRLYLYNFSAMQRRLVDGLHRLDVQGGPLTMSRADFAFRIGRHPSSITRAIESGKIGSDALDGVGRSARVIVDVAVRQLGLDPVTLDL